MHSFKHDDRISHKDKGLGTIVTHPDRREDIEVEGAQAAIGPDTVYVKWDDDRLPVEPVASTDLEPVPDAAAAISTGF